MYIISDIVFCFNVVKRAHKNMQHTSFNHNTVSMENENVLWYYYYTLAYACCFISINERMLIHKIFKNYQQHED